ncbi:uncharacterized protein FFB20_06984 [Fusarium fujikuroi]|nr:uncharacterized protein FFB20_06984 [Fusarium fujikuroi]
MPPRETAKAKRERLAREAEEARLAEEVKAERIAAEEAEAERIATEKAEADRTAAKKAEEKRIAFEKKLKADRIAAQKKKAKEARIAAEKFEAEHAESKQRHNELIEMLTHAKKEIDNKALEEDRIIKKEQLESTPKKRKAVSDAISVTSGSSSSSSDSKEDPIDTLKDFTEKEYRRLSQFFRKVTNHKKKKKKSKGKGKSKSKKAKGSK